MTSRPCDNGACDKEHAELLQAIKDLTQITADCECYLGKRPLGSDAGREPLTGDRLRSLEAFNEANARHREKTRAFVTCLQAHPAKSGRR